MEFLLTMDEFKHLVDSNCYYCDYYHNGEAIGIDRLNNTIGYINTNCVAACEECNRSKHIYHPLFFIDKAKIIDGINIPNLDFYKKWDIYFSRSIARSYNVYKKEAESRSLPFHITETEYDSLIRLPCYLCGYKQTNGIGIDRIDNSMREYNISNSKPCCGSCNTMKNYMETDKFRTLMKRIAVKWIDTTILEKIPLFANPYKKNIKIDNNKIINIPTKERKKWKSLTLYYAILANTESDFIEFNKDVVNSEELENIAKNIRETTNKEDCINQLASFLNTVRIRRARNKKQDDNKISVV
jgi:5-methylcytosine-specific restriction endonuclease McrA